MRTQHLYRERLCLVIAETIVEHRTTDAALQELRELVTDDSIAPYGLRVLAAIELDRNEHEAARQHLQQAIEQREDPDDVDARVDRLLIAHSLLGANEPSQALALLDALITEDEDRVAAIEQARGDALSALGRLDEARRAYERCAQHVGEQLEDRVAAQLDIAWLELERERPDAAIAAIDAVLGDDSSGESIDDAARRLRVARGEHERALGDLRAAVEEARHPASTRERIASDPELAALREHPELTALLAPPRPEARWLDAHPTLVALREHAGLRERGVQFVDEDDAREGGEALREFYDDSLHLGTLWTDALWAECRRVAAPLWLLGKGPTIPGQRHAGELRVELVLYVVPERPDTVWLGPDDEFPAALFTELPVALADLRSAAGQAASAHARARVDADHRRAARALHRAQARVAGRRGRARRLGGVSPARRAHAVAADPAVRESVIEAACAELPLWSDEALRRDAHAEPLRARLQAVRTWTLAATLEPVRAPGLLEAIVALARHEHPVARLAALDLGFVIAPAHREAALALARERVEQDGDYAEDWQHLVASVEAA